MDGHGPHGFVFDEGLSLQIVCEDQRELDRYWDALVEGGGSHGPCGWLKDRFGVSWQVTPANMIEWITSKDGAARDRAFAAMMKMSKIDIATLDSAFRGA
jgi:predicted 3-demethylubiquinone-9 3-methyltransferase (glyoxalase superfamily)